MTINRRTWWPVAVLVVAVLAVALAACGGATGVPSSAAPRTGLAITAVAGPTCPVETVGDPACVPRPVADANVVVLDAQGQEIAKLALDAQGSGVVGLPAGEYVVRAQPQAGLMGTPEAMEVEVADGSLTPVVLSYDTGIRQPM